MAEDFGAAGDAVFRHGNPLMVDCTPTSALAAGAVYCPNDGTSAVCFVAHTAIAAGAKGEVAAFGGVYDVTADATPDTPGIAVYWDASANKITSTATNNTHFGYTLPQHGATDDDDTIRVWHHPALIATGA